MASAENLAHEFWSAVRQHDIERAAALLADDAIFQPAGMRPATGREAVASYLAAMDEEIDPTLETIALYEEMIIVERIDRVAGDPAGRPRDIVSLARVHEGRIVELAGLLRSGGVCGVQRHAERGIEAGRGALTAPFG